MADRFSIINNALVITDTSDSSVSKDFPARDIYYNSAELDNDRVVLYDTNGVNDRGSIVFQGDLADAEDSAGTAFTAASFRTFCRENLGFSSASGGSGARTTNVLNGSPFADFAALETYSQANLSELINSSSEVAVATVTGLAVYEWAGEDTPASYTNSWIVRENLADGISMVDDGFIPLKSGTDLVNSSLRETPTQIISTKTIVAPDASLVVGNYSISNGGFNLGFEELTEERTFYPVVSELETAGSTEPFYWRLGAIITAPSLTPDNESVTGTSIQWVRPVSQTGVGLQYIFRSDIDTDDVNLVVRLNSHTDTPAIFDYQRATGGLFNITTGNNTLDLPVPLFFETGKDLYVTVESANNISLRGDSGVPYLEIQGRPATRIEIPTSVNNQDHPVTLRRDMPSEEDAQALVDSSLNDNSGLWIVANDQLSNSNRSDATIRALTSGLLDLNGDEIPTTATAANSNRYMIELNANGDGLTFTQL